MSHESPTIDYDPDGDLIEVIWESVEFYGDWICHGLVLYRSRDDNRIVGCCIEGISHLVRKSETLEESLADIEAGNVRDIEEIIERMQAP